jgi:hypothetical protein
MPNVPQRRHLFGPESPTPSQPPAPLSAPSVGASPAVAAPASLDPFDLPHVPGEAYPEVTAWVATLAPGTIGTAAQLLPSFLLSGVPPRTRYAVPWTSTVLGIALARLRDRHVAGRYLRRYKTRTGVALWEVVAVPAASAAALS